jgi:hypothetical protein
MMDKSELLVKALDRYGVMFSPTRSGWQSVRCPNELGHAKGDENPSARINLTVGMAKCLGCGLSGDGYNVIMAVEDIAFKAALEALGSVAQRKESMWAF